MSTINAQGRRSPAYQSGPQDKIGVVDEGQEARAQDKFKYMPAPGTDSGKAAAENCQFKHFHWLVQAYALGGLPKTLSLLNYQRHAFLNFVTVDSIDADKKEPIKIVLIACFERI